MKKLTDFCWRADSDSVEWAFAARRIKKSYPFPIRSAITLLDNTGVALVEPNEVSKPNNAVIFNADGSERFRVMHPGQGADGGFDQIYYVRHELTAFAGQQGRSDQRQLLLQLDDN